MTPASIIDTATRAGGTLEDALIAMTAYAGQMRDPNASQGLIEQQLISVLRSAQADRVFELAAAALLRLAEIAPVDGPTQPTRPADDTPAVYTQPRVVTVRSVRDGDEIATWTRDSHLICTLGGLGNAASEVTWHVVDLTSGIRGVHEVTCECGRTWRLNSFSDVVIRERVQLPAPDAETAQETR